MISKIKNRLIVLKQPLRDGNLNHVLDVLKMRMSQSLRDCWQNSVLL